MIHFQYHTICLEDNIDHIGLWKIKQTPRLQKTFDEIHRVNFAIKWKKSFKSSDTQEVMVQQTQK